MSSLRQPDVPVISAVRVTPADPSLRAGGLIAWVSCTLDHRFKIEGLTLRRTAEGDLTVSFAHRADAWGRRWYYFRPLNEETRRAVEQQVLAQVDLDRENAR
jgi:DNA-binding cell septation regulator SpoVG